MDFWHDAAAQKRWLRRFALLTGVLLLPVLVLAVFARPSADDFIYAARTLGMKERTIFWRVVMPAAGPGVASGTVLTFARALGEYGATAMLAGNIAGKTGTISQKIANVIKDGDYATAGVWVVIMLVIALVIIMVINCLSGGKNRKQNRW